MTAVPPRSLAAALSLAILFLPTLATEEKAPRRDRAWVAAQLAAWDLTGDGAPPFRLVAKLEVFSQNGSWVTGSYALTWAAPDRWREELRFPGHEETEALAGDVRWRQRPTRYRPRLPWLLTSTVRGDRFPSPEPKDFRQTKPKGGNPALACIGNACVNAFTGEPHAGEVFDVTIGFDSPEEFPLRRWPRAYHAMEDGREIARAAIQTLESLDAPDAAAFSPPAGADQTPACGRPTAPRVIPSTKVKPPYPEALRQEHVEGFARLRATIASDGSVQEIELSRATHPQLGDLALDAVRQWRYEPALCGDRPVPIEVWLKVRWDLQ